MMLSNPTTKHPLMMWQLNLTLKYTRWQCNCIDQGASFLKIRWNLTIYYNFIHRTTSSSNLNESKMRSLAKKALHDNKWHDQPSTEWNIMSRSFLCVVTQWRVDDMGDMAYRQLGDISIGSIPWDQQCGINMDIDSMPTCQLIQSGMLVLIPR